MAEPDKGNAGVSVAMYIHLRIFNRQGEEGEEVF
jgi:hypothetical protein